MRPDFDASVFRQAGKARAQGLDGAKKKDRKIDVATFVSPGILACIRANPRKSGIRVDSPRGVDAISPFLIYYSSK